MATDSTFTRWASTTLLLGVSLFQVALAAGAPWGRMAWGGTQVGVLPPPLRVCSGAAAMVYVGLAVLAWSGPGSPGRRRALRGAAALTAVGAVLNLASPSLPEKLLWTPVAVALTVLLWRRARQSSRPKPRLPVIV